MKKSFYSIASLVLSLSVFSATAQVVLTRNSFPLIGDQQAAFLYDTSGVDHGESGVNKIWDFSNIIKDKSAGTMKYLSPSNTPNGSKFPGSNIAQTDPTVEQGYSYALLDDKEFTGYGVTLSQQGGTSTVVYSNKLTAMIFPFAFNSIHRDNFAGTIKNTVTPYVTFRTGTVSFQGDGTGQIILPDGRKYAALRTKAIQEIEDVTDLDVYKSYIKSSTVSYSWYASEMKGQLMSIHFIDYESYIIEEGDTMLMQAARSKSVVVYEPVVASVEKEFLKGDLFSLSPNPISNEGVVSFILEAPSKTVINLKNTQGVLLKTIYSEMGQSGENKVQLNMSEETSGMYFVEIISGNNRAYRKLIKK